MTIGSGASDVITLASASQDANTYTAITGFTSHNDTLTFATNTHALTFNSSTANITGELASTAVFQDYVNLAINSTTTGGVDYFDWNGNTFVVANQSGAHSFQNGTDVVVELTGIQNLSGSTTSGHSLIHA